jgi:hypothetical protein
LAPLISGLLVQATGSFLPAFLLAAAIAFACALAYAAMAGRRIGVG